MICVASRETFTRVSVGLPFRLFGGFLKSITIKSISRSDDLINSFYFIWKVWEFAQGRVAYVNTLTFRPILYHFPTVPGRVFGFITTRRDMQR